MTRLRCVIPPRVEATRRSRAHRAGRLVLCIALVLAGCGSAPPSLNPAQQVAMTASQAAARSLARGEVAPARAAYERALAAAESVEDFELAGTALLNLALLQARSGELTAAHAQLDRILAAPQRYGPALFAGAAARKALVHLDGPDLEAALTWADAAQNACPTPCAHGAAMTTLRAHVALQRGDAAAAASLAATAVNRAAQAGQAAEQANALRLLGRAHTRAEQTALAAPALAQALAIDQRLGLPERVALDLLYAGDNEQRRSNAAAAREFYDRALVVYRAAGMTQAADSVRARLDSLGRADSPKR